MRRHSGLAGWVCAASLSGLAVGMLLLSGCALVWVGTGSDGWRFAPAYDSALGYDYSQDYPYYYGRDEPSGGNDPDSGSDTSPSDSSGGTSSDSGEDSSSSGSDTSTGDSDSSSGDEDSAGSDDDGASVASR